MLIFNQPSFLDRTVLSYKVHGNATALLFGGKRYRKIHSEINWVEAKNTLWSSVGSSKNREHLLFDENSAFMEGLKELAVERCQHLRGNIPALLAEVNFLVNLLTFQPGLTRNQVEATLDDKLHAYIDRKKASDQTNDSPYITMNELVRNRILVCRHKAILAACLLAELVKTGILPEGIVRQYRSNIQHGTHEGVHTWAVYREENSNDLWICDPRWDYVQNVSRSFQAAANQGYGTATIYKMISRLNKLDNEEFVGLNLAPRTERPMACNPEFEDTSYDEEYDVDADNAEVNLAETILETLEQHRQQQYPQSRITIEEPPEVNLDFLNDNLQAEYERIQRENSLALRFVRGFSKSITHKSERRLQAITELQGLFRNMQENSDLPNEAKAVLIYAHLHNLQLAINAERNTFRSHLADLCMAYKHKLRKLLQNHLMPLAAIAQIEASNVAISVQTPQQTEPLRVENIRASRP